MKFGKQDMDGDTMVGLTDDGKQALDALAIKGKNSYSILATLHERSPQSLSNLYRETRMRPNDLKKLVERLRRQRLIQVLSVE